MKRKRRNYTKEFKEEALKAAMKNMLINPNQEVERKLLEGFNFSLRQKKFMQKKYR
ncbi:MAG: hypothetical protein K8R67_06320 [Desulfobacteraceae bacterium]|nr:hypothetical protein [Desulfobacteraceae bacterium]